MPDIRAFIAIELNQDVQRRLGEIQQEFIAQRIHCVRWVSAKNIHLTMQFLGDTSPAKLDILAKELQPVIAAQEPFSFQVRDIGAFPNIRRPRVIWIGLEAPSALATLQKLIARTVHKVGLPVEEREFSPHLTLGRVKNSAAPVEIQGLSAVLEDMKIGVLGKVMVKSVTLFRSDLCPDGPLYTSLAHLPMKG